MIPVFLRLRQEDHKFDVSLDHIIRSYFKTQQKKIRLLSTNNLCMRRCVVCPQVFVRIQVHRRLCAHVCEASRHPGCHSPEVIHLVSHWPGPCHVEQAGWPLDARDLPASAFSLLGLQVCAVVPIFLRTWVLGVGKASSVLIALFLMTSVDRVTYRSQALRKELKHEVPPSQRQRCVLMKDSTKLPFFGLF